MDSYPSKKDFVIQFSKETKEEVEVKLEKKLNRYQYKKAYKEIVSDNQTLTSKHLTSYKAKKKKFSSYIINQELILAIKSALITGRPLLLKGEPGSGKTKLALAIAVAMYGKDAYKHYFEWHIKSYSKAKDGGYTFDHIKRLRDTSANNENIDISPINYVDIGPLGMAFLKSQKDKPAILLIDEIDKSDIDFPNDLLLELDENRVVIPELDGKNNQIIAKERPLVIITSNDERTLPPAFLRRCLYHKIKLAPSLFEKIIISKLKKIQEELKVEFGLESLKNPLTEENAQRVVEMFTQLRDDIGNNTFSGKRSSTSELIDWVKMIQFILSTDPNEPTLEKLLKQNFPSEDAPYNLRSLILKQKLDT